MKVGPSDGVFVSWQRVQGDEAKDGYGEDIGYPCEAIALPQSRPNWWGLLTLLLLYYTLVQEGHSNTKEHSMELCVRFDNEEFKDEDILRRKQACSHLIDPDDVEVNCNAHCDAQSDQDRLDKSRLLL